MKLSTDRILTTHVGSLPRSQAVVDVLMAREHGTETDPKQFEAVVSEAVREVVKLQADAGIDVISDGELSKIGYATYIKDRLTGFDGHQPRKVALDLADYPEYQEKMALVAGKQSFKRLCCTGPVEVSTTEPLNFDLKNFKSAVDGANVTDAFMNAASPGVVSAFQPNQYYPSIAEYLEAISKAMQPEYEAIVDAGFVLQLDCPDLAMARHTGFQDLTEAEFLAQAELQVEALNAALVNIPAEKLRMHVCWGNYEGPHTYDIDLRKIMNVILKAKPSAILFEASNPRHAHEWQIWKETKLPDNKILVPGVIDSTSNYVEHPELIAQRIQQFTDIVGRERVMAGTDCGFATFAGVGKVDSKIVWKKLASLAEGAALASKKLF
ncbi:cobalamin-independent methionine synthase II family protein [Saccharospirillum mangrovi]|uniref:cobalamin-independent methionine synthase II family protein n=1 Tax=Saccharospirillum mangrovi TaxID=2161747 RepID=UPI000D3D16C1|nr:cobalamin-independent methionine synthase II family protein [Saccharospirillum mangrovi]